MIKLYHYSNKDFKGYIRPDYFGENNYSRNSEDISGVKRSYFYLDRESREFYFSGVKFRYIVKINKKRLYNLNKDKLGLAGRVKDIFRAVKSRGYIGLIGSNGYSCGVLFYPAKIKGKEILTK